MIYFFNFRKMIICRFLLALMSIIMSGCSPSNPSKEVIAKEITDAIHNSRAPLMNDKFSDIIGVTSVDVVDQRLEGDRLTIIAKITATCKTKKHASYIAAIMGPDNHCKQAGQVISNESEFNMIKFDSGWRVQPRKSLF